MVKQILIKNIEEELKLLYNQANMLENKIKELKRQTNDHWYVGYWDDIFNDLRKCNKELNAINYKIAVLEDNKERYTKCLSSK